MAKKVRAKEVSNEPVVVDLDSVPRFKDKTMDELFWDAKGFKQCLWTIYEANKFNGLTTKQLEAAWDEYNKIEAFTMSKYGPKIDQMETKKDVGVKAISKSVDEVNLMLSATRLRKLKRIWDKILAKKDQYSDDEFKRLEQIKNKRRDELKQEREEA